MFAHLIGTTHAKCRYTLPSYVASLPITCLYAIENTKNLSFGVYFQKILKNTNSYIKILIFYMDLKDHIKH